MPIVKVTSTPQYGRYFLYVEAPGDTPTVSRTQAGRNSDPLSSANIPDISDSTDIPGIGVGGNDGGSSGGPDVGDDGGADAVDSPSVSSGGGGSPDTSGGPDLGGGGDDFSPDTGDTGAVDDVAGGDDASTGDAGGGPDTGSDDDVDFGDGTDDSTGEGDDGSGDDGSGGYDNSGGDNNGVALDYNATRIWQLSKEFIALHNALDVYTTKLNGIIVDNEEADLIIKKCTDSLVECKDLVYDYLTVKFSLSSYVQNLIFYEKMVTTIKLIFKNLKEAFELAAKAHAEPDKKKSTTKTSDDKKKPSEKDDKDEKDNKSKTSTNKKALNNKKQSINKYSNTKPRSNRKK